MQKPKRKSSRVLWILLGILGVIVLFILALFALLWINRSAQAQKDFNSRPLVLIHAPINHEVIQTGSAVLVHATARQQAGLRQVELWVDDVLVAARPAPQGENPDAMVLSESWVATLAGRHTLVVRATSANGVQGQAAVIIEVEESARAVTGVYPVEEGDTIAAIAEEVGITPEELTDLNPELEGGEPSEGDELVVPGGEDSVPDGGGESLPPGGEEEPAPGGEEEAIPDEGGIEEVSDEDEPAPEPEADPPGGFDFSGLLFGMFEIIPFPTPPADPVGLKMEVLTLQTSGAEESLHCYVSLGNQAPRWVPDVDGDPATDESFTPLADGDWEVQPYLAGDAAPVIYWPDNQDLNFDINCIGIAAGGTDALDLGVLELSIPPENWDGGLRFAIRAGPEGHIFMQYRVSRLPADLRALPLILDPDMTPPTNVRLDERRNSLRWDYNPQPGEAPISGFRVYLNGSLQWVEDAETLESGLPYEWFNPPCGSTYNFAVTAYRFELPDGPESPPGEVSRTTPAEGCQREIQINLISLETFDLGDDGRYEDRGGDVGPPYGHFYANDWRISFDARPPGSGGGSLDMPLGLTHNTMYNLGAIASDPAWRFSGVPYTVVGVPVGGTFEFGYRIMDQDTGRCNDSDDPGCDDLVCEGLSPIYEDSASGEFNRLHEGTLTSGNGRCRLAYSFGPAFGSPVGSGVPGWEPMPWIAVEDVIIDPSTGRMQIPVRNTGTATWPWRDLEVGLQTRSGESLGIFTWETFVLEAGQRTVLEHPDIRIEAPYDACVVIDPNNLVMEEYEAHEILFHNPVCPQLPDLIIRDVVFDSSGGGRLRVTVENIGESALQNRTVALYTGLSDGSPAYLMGSWPNVSLDINQTRTFDLIGVTESVRASLQNGYTVEVDPDRTIAEIDTSNNSYEIQSAQLRVWWCDGYIPHYHGLGSATHMYFTVDILRGTQVETIFSPMERYNRLTGTETFSYGYNHCYLQGCNFAFSCDENSEEFTILGDEALRVTVRADFRAGSFGDYENLGSASQIWQVEQNWGARPGDDSGSEWGFSNQRRLSVVPPIGMLLPPAWWSEFCIVELP